MEPTPPTVCWICLKPVSPAEKPDEFGFFAHEKCLKKPEAANPLKDSSKA
jgi:hypothetical protein